MFIYICIYLYPIVFSSSSRLSVVVMLSFYDAWDAAENEEFYEAWEAAEAAFSQQRGHEAPSSAVDADGEEIEIDMFADQVAWDDEQRLAVEVMQPGSPEYDPFTVKPEPQDSHDPSIPSELVEEINDATLNALLLQAIEERGAEQALQSKARPMAASVPPMPPLPPPAKSSGSRVVLPPPRPPPPVAGAANDVINFAPPAMRKAGTKYEGHLYVS
jgi:hypothetical protein